jgi:hypothetical protein
MASKWVSLPASRVSIPRLYRCILKAAQSYPSVKRESIIADIKTEFRQPVLAAAAHPDVADTSDGADVDDVSVYFGEGAVADALQKRVDVALNGLQTLLSYSRYSPGNYDPNWSLSLLSNPVTAARDAAFDRSNFLALDGADQTAVLEMVGLARAPLTAAQIAAGEREEAARLVAVEAAAAARPAELEAGDTTEGGLWENETRFEDVVPVKKRRRRRRRRRRKAPPEGDSG